MMGRGAIVMLLVLGLGDAAAPAARGEGEWMLPESRMGIRTAPLLLLSRPDVRADVGLDDRQAADAWRTLAALYTQAAAVRGKTDAEADATRHAILVTQQRWIESRLSPAQRTRLIQIDLQWEGPAALVTRPVVTDTLALSLAQRTTLTRAVAERNQKRARGPAQRSDDRLLAEQALATLSEEQKQRWKAMLGRPFIPQVASNAQTSPR
jgi:hypothetical protein